MHTINADKPRKQLIRLPTYNLCHLLTKSYKKLHHEVGSLVGSIPRSRNEPTVQLFPTARLSLDIFHYNPSFSIINTLFTHKSR